MREEMQIFEKQNDGVLGYGLVEGSGDLNERVVVFVEVGLKVGTYYRHEAFRRYVIH